jgi:hypothetical protein
MKRKIGVDIFLIALFAFVLVLGLSGYYRDGSFILGGEGNFVFDFNAYFKNFGYTWHPTIFGIGTPNRSPMASGLNVLSLCAVQNATGSVAAPNLFLMFMIYFLPFLAMFALARESRLASLTAFLVASFYVFNPFVLYDFVNMNQWNLFPVTMMPLILFLLIRYYGCYLRLFFWFGAVCALLSFAFTNPPLLLITWISVACSTLLVSVFKEGAVRVKTSLKHFLTLLGAFFVFSAWWILPMGWALFCGEKIYSQAFADGWLTATVKGAYPIFARIFTFTGLIPRDPSYDFFSFWYTTWPTYLVMLIPVAIGIFAVFFSKKAPQEKKPMIFALMLCCAIIFFVKGNALPLGSVYIFLYKFVPFFNFFKTPVEKFGLLYIFLFTVFLIFSLRFLVDERRGRLAVQLLSVCVLFCSAPVLTGNIVPNFKTGVDRIVSRKYQLRPADLEFLNKFNADTSDYRVLFVPGVGNYQVLFQNADGSYYSGMDPFLMNMNKSGVASYSSDRVKKVLFDEMSNDRFCQLLGLFDIRTIFVNPEQLPWFGYVGEANRLDEFEKLWSGSMRKLEAGHFILYEVPPGPGHIYVASS